MANNTERLSVQLALESGSFSQQMTAINKAIKNLDRDFKSAGRGVDGFEKTFVGLDAKIKKTSTQIELYNKKLDKQKEKYNNLSSTLERQKSKLAELESTLGKNSNEWKKQAELVQRNSSKLERLGSDISSTESNLSSLGTELNQATLSFQRLGQQSQSINDRLANISREANLAESEFNLLGSELNQSGQYFQRLGNDIQRMGSEIQQNQNRLSAYQSEISRLNTELTQNQQRHSSLATEIQQVETELEQARSAYGETATETQQLNQRLLRLRDDFNSCENGIEQSTNALNNYQTEVNNTQANINRLSGEMQRLPFDRIGHSLQNVGGTVRNIGQNMNTYVSLPLAGAGVAIGKMSYDFAQGLGKVGSLVGKSGSEMKAYEDKIKSISDQTGVSLSQMTESMYQGISAGADLSNIFSLLETSSKLSIGGFTSQETAIDGLTTAMNSFGLSYDEVNSVSDKFILTQNKGKTTVDELASSIGQVAPTANAAGVSLDELLSATASLTMNGVKTSESMTSMKAALSNVIKPSAEAQKVAQSLGLEFSSTALESKGLAGFLEDIKQKTGGNVDTMAKLFGSTEALNAILLLTGEGADEFSGVLSDMNNTAGLTEKAFSNMKESAGSDLLDSINSLKNSLMEMGDALAPAIEVASDGISNLAKWFNSLDEQGRKNVLTMSGLAIALGPILTGIGTLLQIGGSTSIMLGSLASSTAVASGATAGATGAFAGLSGVIGTIGTVALPALALGLAALIENLGSNEDAISSLQDKWGTFGTVVGGSLEVLSGLVELTLGNLMIGLGGVGKALMAFVKGDIEEIPNIMKETNAKLNVNAAEAANNISGTTTRALSTLKTKSEQELKGVEKTFEIALKNLPNLTNDKIGKVAETFTNNLSKLDSESIEILKGTSDSMNVLFNGISSSMSKTEAMKTFQNNLKDMVQSGKFDADTLQKDIEKAMNLIDQNVSDSSSSVKKSATDMFNAFKESAKFGVEGALGEVVGQLGNMEQATLDQLTSMGSTWSSVFDGIKLDGSMSTQQMKDAVLQNISKMGIDSDTLISQLRKESSEHWRAIAEDAKKSGNQVAISLDQVPKEIITKFKSNGIEEEQQILSYYNILMKLPPEIQTYILAENTDALINATNVEEVLANIPTEKLTSILTNISNSGSMPPEQLQEILKALPDEERVKIETAIKGEDKVDKVKKDVEELPKDKKTNVNVETGDSSQKVNEVKKDVEKLPKEKNTKINSDTKTASKNVTGLKKNLSDYDKKHTGKTKTTKFKTVTSTASKNVSGLKRNIADYVSRYAGKTYTTTFRTVTTKVNNVVTKSSTAKGSSASTQAIKPLSTLAQPQVSPMIRAQAENTASIQSQVSPKASVFATSTPISNIAIKGDDIGNSMKYDIDLLTELNNKIQIVNNSLSLLDTKMEHAVGKDKIKYLQDQNTLYSQQIKLQKDLEDKLNRQKNYYEWFLKSKGFHFDKDGVLANYEEKLIKMKKEIEKLDHATNTGNEKAKESAQKRYDAEKKKLDEVNKYIQEYINVTTSGLPDCKNEWEKLNNSIRNNSEEIKKLQNEKWYLNIESTLTSINRDVQDVNNQLEILEVRMKNAFGYEKLGMLGEQISLLQRYKKELGDTTSYFHNIKSQLVTKLKGFGFEIRDNGTIGNYIQQLDKLKDTSENFEDAKKLVKEYLDLFMEKIPQAEKELEDLNNKIKDSYKEQLNITSSIEKEITDVYKHELEDRKKLIDEELKKRVDNLNKEKKAYNDVRKESNYKNDYDEQVAKIIELEKKLDISKKDNSLSGQKKVQDLLKQIKEENENLYDLVQDKIDQDINDMFDNEKERLEDVSDKTIKDLENKFSNSKLSELVKEALGSGVFTDIDGNVKNLQDTMLDFTDRFGEGLSITGDLIKNELIGNLQVAMNTVKNYANIMDNLDITKYSNAIKSLNIDYYSDRYNPTTTPRTNNTNSNTLTIQFNEPLMVVRGDITKDVLPEVKEMMKETEKRIVNNIAKNYKY